MAMAFEPVKFLLNQTDATSTGQAVEAPAFSLTKVLAVVAPLLTAVTAFATSALEDVEFDSGQITLMIVALVAFLAITAAADVLARGIATSAEKKASGRLRLLRFDKPLTARLGPKDAYEDVTVLAASDAEPPEYLCLHEDQTVTWETAGRVRIP